MSEIIDHSDQISQIKSLLSMLHDSDPTGNWSQNKLVIKWRRSHYSLSSDELIDLSILLEVAWKKASREAQHSQGNLFH